MAGIIQHHLPHRPDHQWQNEGSRARAASYDPLFIILLAGLLFQMPDCGQDFGNIFLHLPETLFRGQSAGFVAVEVGLAGDFFDVGDEFGLFVEWQTFELAAQFLL